SRRVKSTQGKGERKTQVYAGIASPMRPLRAQVSFFTLLDRRYFFRHAKLLGKLTSSIGCPHTSHEETSEPELCKTQPGSFSASGGMSLRTLQQTVLVADDVAMCE